MRSLVSTLSVRGGSEKIQGDAQSSENSFPRTELPSETFRGVQFMVRHAKDGWFSLVNLPSGTVLVYNGTTAKPCSDARSARFFTKRFIKDATRDRLKYRTFQYWRHL